jgi:hypothetical protein
VSQLHTFDEPTRTEHIPAIFELLSELEKRDAESRGIIEHVDFTATGFQDPRGCAVINTTGNDVGKVEDIYVDPNTREPRFVLLNLGKHPLGIDNRHVLVDFCDVEIRDESHVRVRAGV